MCLDIFRTFRVLWKHGKLGTAAEDIVFLLIWAGSLVCFATVFARGEMRGYYVFGSFMGILLYRCTVGCVTVPLLRRIFQRIGWILEKVWRPISHGVVRICKRIYRKFGYNAKVLEKLKFFSNLPLIAWRKMLYNKKVIKNRRQRRDGKRKISDRKKATLDL